MDAKKKKKEAASGLAWSSFIEVLVLLTGEAAI